MKRTNVIGLGLVGLLGIAVAAGTSCGKSKQTVEEPGGGGGDGLGGGSGEVGEQPGEPDPAAAHAQAIERVKTLKAEADKDPVLVEWTGPYQGVPPWDKLDVNAMPKAFEKGLELLLAELEVISTNPEPPTFANTFIPLNDAGRHQDRAEVLFSVMSSNLSTPEVQALDKEWSPKITAAYDKMYFDPRLFARIKTIYDGRATGLDAD